MRRSIPGPRLSSYIFTVSARRLKTQELKKKLADGITTDWIDEIYKAGIKNGAYGGKLMGAGGGGFFYFLAPPKLHDKIKKELISINIWVPFKFDFEGSRLLTLG